MMYACTSTWRRRGLLDEKNPPRNSGSEVIGVLSTAAITLAVCGDPVICRALVLILQCPDYDVKYVPTASLGAPGALGGVQVLLLALERDGERRREILELLEEATDGSEIRVLELSAAFEIGPERPRERAWAEGKIPWPCSTEELKRHIKIALTDGPPTGGVARGSAGEGAEG